MLRLLSLAALPKVAPRALPARLANNAGIATPTPLPRAAHARMYAKPGPNAAWAKQAEFHGVEFVSSYDKPAKMPALALPEFALVGRSNVGKSSCLNTLAGRRKKVAKVSKTPGRTRLINLFRVGKSCAVVDLPGYGFAKVSGELQEEWRLSIEQYLRSRAELFCVIVLVDLSVPPQAKDAQILDFLEANDINTLVVATKADKVSGAERVQQALVDQRAALELPDEQPLLFSSTTGDGRSDLWRVLEDMAKESPRR